MARRLALLACAALVAVGAGCGGDDGGDEAAPRARIGGDALLGAPASQAERVSPRLQAIREAKEVALLVVDVINHRDPSACRFFTERYIERVTRAQGEAAREQCRRNVAAPTGRSEIVDFGRSRFGGDTVVLDVTLAASGRNRDYTVTFVRGRRPGSWLIDARNP